MISSCPECDGKLSSEASVCPHCGYRAKKNSARSQAGKLVKQSAATYLAWIWRRDIGPDQQIRSCLGAPFAVLCGLLSLSGLFGGLGLISTEKTVLGILCLLAGIVIWVGVMLPIMRRLPQRAQKEPAVSQSNIPDQGMPHPELLENEQLLNSIGTRERSFSVTTFRVIMIDQAWGQRTENILQLDEVDSYGTDRVSELGWKIAAILTFFGSIGAGIYMGNQPKANESTVTWIVVGGIVLSAIFYGIYRASIGYVMQIRSKTLTIEHRTDIAGLPIAQEFLQSVQKAVQEAKVRQ